MLRTDDQLLELIRGSMVRFGPSEQHEGERAFMAHNEFLTHNEARRIERFIEEGRVQVIPTLRAPGSEQFGYVRPVLNPANRFPAPLR